MRYFFYVRKESRSVYQNRGLKLVPTKNLKGTSLSQELLRFTALKPVLNKIEIDQRIVEVSANALTLKMSFAGLKECSHLIIIEKGQNFSLELPETLKDVKDILEEIYEPISLLGTPNRTATIWLDEIYDAQSGSNGRLGIFMKISSNVPDDYVVVAAPLDLTVTGQRHELTEADLRELLKNIPGLTEYAGKISTSEAEVRMRLYLLRDRLSRINDDTPVVPVETGMDFCKITGVPQNFGQLMGVIKETLAPITGAHQKITPDDGSKLFYIHGNNPQRGISAWLDEIRAKPWQESLGVFMAINRLFSSQQDHALVAVPLGITVTGHKLDLCIT